MKEEFILNILVKLRTLVAFSINVLNIIRNDYLISLSQSKYS